MGTSWCQRVAVCVLLAACGGGGGGRGTGGSTPVSVSTFADCFNLALMETAGTTASSTYQYSGTSGGTSFAGTYQLDQRAGNLTTFNGQRAYETTYVYTMDYTVGSIHYVSTQTSKSYDRQTAPGVITSYGETTTETDTQNGTVVLQQSSVTTYAPASVSSLLNLAVGTTLSEGDSSTTVTTHLIPSGADTTETTSSTYFYRFVGVEDITVPAGTYRACKVEARDSPSAAAVTTIWWVVGKGQIAKSVSSNPGVSSSTTEATSLKFNGVAF